MIHPKKFLGWGVTFAFFLLLILVFLTLFNNVNQVLYKSILIGNSLAFLNLIMGLLSVFWGIEKSKKKFLISLYGGMLLRLILLLILMVLTLKFLDINEISFIFSFLFFYFFYLIFEIIYLNFRKR